MSAKADDGFADRVQYLDRVFGSFGLMTSKCQVLLKEDVKCLMA